MFQGIDGLNGSNQQPWGAVVTIGEKGPSGAPTNTDRFFIKKAQAETTEFRGRNALVRRNHPDFEKYNRLDDLRWRQTIRFNLVHSVHLRDGWASVEPCFQFQLKAQQLPRIQGHPKKVPTCVGDGIKARRYAGEKNGEHVFNDIDCPHRLCQFRQGSSPSCKPSSRFAFQLRWHDGSSLPTPLVKFVTHSWHNTNKAFIPFFNFLHEQAMALGATDYSLYGLPGVMTLGRKSMGNNRSVPVVSVSTDFPPGVTLQEFFLAQRTKLKELSGIVPLRQITDDSPQEQFIDAAEIEPGLPAVFDVRGE
jgi:hypothetical protein